MNDVDHGYDGDLTPLFIYGLCHTCRKWVRYDLEESSVQYRQQDDGYLRYGGPHKCRGKQWNTSMAWRTGDPTNYPLRIPGDLWCVRGSHPITMQEVHLESGHECCGRTFRVCKPCMEQFPRSISTAQPGETWAQWFYRMMHQDGTCPTRCDVCKEPAGRYELRWDCVPHVPKRCGKFCRYCFDGHRAVHRCKKKVVRNCTYTCPACKGGAEAFTYQDGRTTCSWCGSSWWTEYERGRGEEDDLRPPTVGCVWCGPNPCTCATQIEALT